ncbi:MULTISPECIES: hypothetical protein [Hydrocarboniphaga]|uniref:hypothetical protein n=1 Tax=Hydrocarboniphaga TaxID=243627 RepID=UPI0012F7720B|nr:MULTISPECIES: hypothetical protein [Hydrocarboniphaga]MDZ4077210.1 hypothetical protein [Hydrocarboniphaga sp.]
MSAAANTVAGARAFAGEIYDSVDVALAVLGELAPKLCFADRRLVAAAQTLCRKALEAHNDLDCTLEELEGGGV